ncbi:MAG: SDR family oxidoreductase [Actinomycetota bacterium]
MEEPAAPRDLPFADPIASGVLGGRIAIVTGGGTGIGRATASALARAGASVAICGRREEPIREVERELTAAGTACLALATDVRESEQVDALLDAVDERFGRVDILVNNAGGQFAAAAEETSTKGMRAVHRLNVDAVWDVTTKVANRWMIPRRRGVIFAIGFSPRRGIPQMVHSSMARSALETLASGLSLEWSRFGVRAICIACGLIASEGLEGYGGSEVVKEWASQVPLGRAGSVDEVAAAIAFLSTDAAGYITGTTVMIDGGADAWGLGFSPPVPDG